ncbi:class IV adenylate cyclase [Kribbella lupini]|uniref:CYTH domain-containing protein n=1 Tax=Kribbella lupini TaxID=291602 RepID=A0ABN2AY38_9ACTN
MPIEYEAKVLDIDAAAIRRRIATAGGRRLGEVLLRRFVYDVTPGDTSRWIRLRDDGSQATLTVKEIAHDGIDGTTETEVTVGDFADAHELVQRMGFRAKSYQENRRESFELAGARLEIDSWPLIPAYLEIEGSSRDHVVEVAGLLGVEAERLTGENTVKVTRATGSTWQA